jgi:zinc/manganese transport system substrate-binding protein
MNPFKISRIFLFCCILSILSTCANFCTAADKLKIVTTITSLGSIAKSVGDDKVTVSSICGGDEDPHFAQAKPSFMMKANKADLWICVGMELEIGYQGLILQGSRNPKIQVGSSGYMDASEGISKLEVPTEKVSRAMGDVHPMGNPHYWLDPYNGRIIAASICNRLKQLDPEHSADYNHNLNAFLLKLDNAMFGDHLVKAVGGEQLWKKQSDSALESFIKNYNDKILQADPNAKDKTLSLGGWLSRLEPLAHAKIVIYHRSWPYFFHRFNLEDVAELEPKPGIPPGPQHLLEVINTIKAKNAKVILMEPFYDRKHADFVAKKTGVKVIVVPNSVDKQITDYIAMLDNIVTKLTNALK